MTVDFDQLVADDLGAGTTNVGDFAAVVARAAGWSDDVPVLLFPVRIETRFVQREQPVPRPPRLERLVEELALATERLAWIGSRELVTVIEKAGEPGRARKRDQRRLDEKAAHVEVLAAIATARDAVTRATELARIRMPGTDGNVKALGAELDCVDGGFVAARGAIATLRSPYQRTEATTALDELASGVTALRSTIERRTISAARTIDAATTIVDELWVRIYPDDIAVDTHEDLLTESERVSGLTFWTETVRAGADDTLERGAWRVLCQRHGARRAAWVARVTKPAAEPPAQPAVRVLRSLEVLDRRLEEIAGAGDPARLRAFDRAVADLRAAIPDKRVADSAVLERSAPMVATIRRRLGALGADVSRKGMRRAELDPPRARALSVLRELRTWTSDATRDHQARRDTTSVRRADTVTEGTGGGVVRALGTFADRLDEIATWEAGRIESWVKSLARAMDGVDRALASDGGASRQASLRAERLMSTVVAKLRGLATQARRKELPPELAREVRRKAARMGAAWNRWRARAAAAPREDVPALPALETKAAPWTRAASSTILPERFVVVTVSGDKVSHVVVGRPVPIDLKLGLDPDPAAGPAEAFSLDGNNNLVVGASIKWMVDYPEAMRKGMAITIPITPAEATTGFDRVYVLGLCAGTPADGQRRVTALLENHHYGQTGLGLLPIGTATNNSEAAAAGYRSTDDPDAAFEIERGAPLFTSAAAIADAKDGQHLATALGIAPETLFHVEHAGGTDIAEAMAVNKALWPATLGHYFEEFFGSLFPVPILDQIKAHALAHVAGRGLVPALRIGTQPYGVLPTTAFSKLSWTGPARGLVPVMTTVLRTMNTDWATIRDARVKHAHSAGVTDAQQHFLEMLGLEGASVAAEYRFALNCARQEPPASDAEGLLDFGIPGDSTGTGTYGPAALIVRFAEAFRSALNLAAGAPLVDGQVGAAFEKAYKRLTKTRAYEVRYLAEPRPLTGALVGEHAAYIAQLLLQDTRPLAEQTRSEPADPLPLLYLLLRQALLLETREAALRILADEHMLTAEARRRSGESDVFQVHSLSQDWSVTRWSYLFAPLSKLDGRFEIDFPAGPADFYTYLKTGAATERPMDAYLSPRTSNPVFLGFPGRGPHQPHLDKRDAHVATVEHLATIPRDRLERLVLEHLDTCGHRLDAWMTGLAHRRLMQMRAAAANGIHVGAYGWVEDLRPDATHAIAAGVPAELVDDLRIPIHVDEENQGFIHAPSLNHAVTASILRSGYLSEVTQPDVENRMAVNLSSRRVRLAEELIEGVRMGNDLGSLLGYMFERHLHESFATSGITLDDLIEPFRTAYPSQLAVDPALATEDTARRRVVDGLALVQTVLAWVRANPRPSDKDRTLFEILHDAGSYGGHPFGVAVLPPTSKPTRLDVVLRGLDRVADALDAVGDLVVSEGVYQIVQGNHARAAAAVGALARGKAPPPPEIIRTPRSGVAVSHRVMLALAPIDAGDFSPQTVLDPNARAAARVAALPAAWNALPMTPRAAAEPTLNRWLGDRLGAPAKIRARIRNRETQGVIGVVTAADLALQPIDLLAILGPGFDAGRVELTARLLDFVRPVDVVDAAPPPRLDVDFSPDPTWPDDVHPFQDASALVECLHDLLGHGRPANGHDFALAEGAAVAAAIDTAELTLRAVHALDDLEAVGVELLDLLTGGTVVDPAQLGTADLAGFVIQHQARYLTEPGFDAMRRFKDLGAFWALRNRIRLALLAAANLGFARALPPTTFATEAPVREPAARTLLDKLQAAFVDVATRWRVASEADAARTTATDPTPPLVAMIKAIFGEAFPVIPHFTLDAGGAAAESLADPHPPDDDPVLTGWLHGAATVRENTVELAQLFALAEAFGGDAPTGQPLQLPYVAGEPWLGGAFPGEFTPTEARLSLPVFGADALAIDGTSSCAVVVDQWDEIIPNRDETTAVAFHYDQPDAMPPQSLLVVVPPIVSGAWKWHHVAQTLHETFELAKNRAVELEHLHDDLYGQILPGVVGELVPEMITTTEGEIAGSRVILDLGANNPPPSAQP